MSYPGDCPNCLRNIKTNAKFCKYCGTVLKLCPKCRKINKGDDSFCAECGSDITTVIVPKSAVTKKVPAESKDPTVEMVRETVDGERQQKLILWPPTPASRGYAPVRQPVVQHLPDGPPVTPASQVVYRYSKVKALGFLGGPLPTADVVSATAEAFGIALALIAAGVVLFGIGMAFFQYLVFPIIFGVIGAALLLSAPFFGIYYVSSNWLYRAFGVQRPVRLMTVIWNYVLSTLLFSIVGLMLAPIFLIEDMSFGLIITFSIVGGVVYLMGLIVVPLKAYWADLIYIKAAMTLKEEEDQRTALEILEDLDEDKKKGKKITNSDFKKVEKKLAQEGFRVVKESNDELTIEDA